MAKAKALIFGSSVSLKSPEAQRLKSVLETFGFAVSIAMDPIELSPFAAAFLLIQEKIPPPTLKKWLDHFAATSFAGTVGAITAQPLAPAWHKGLRVAQAWSWGQDVSPWIKKQWGSLAEAMVGNAPSKSLNLESMNESLDAPELGVELTAAPVMSGEKTEISSKNNTAATDAFSDLMPPQNPSKKPFKGSPAAESQHSIEAPDKANFSLKPTETGMASFEIDKTNVNFVNSLDMTLGSVNEGFAELGLTKTSIKHHGGSTPLKSPAAALPPKPVPLSLKPAAKAQVKSSEPVGDGRTRVEAAPEAHTRVEKAVDAHTRVEAPADLLNAPADLPPEESPNTMSLDLGAMLMSDASALPVGTGGEIHTQATRLSSSAGSEENENDKATMVAFVGNSDALPPLSADPDEAIGGEFLQNQTKLTDAPSPLLPRSSSHDMSTLERYAALKEREAREKEATIQVLQGQTEKLQARLAKSEAERRRLQLSSEELEAAKRACEDEIMQKKYTLQKLESTHQEELRALQLRLDGALFEASKAQNKLEDFRDRVRSDIIKIRAHERELSNKLELQKRDAEALLSAKDEKLLQQKREVDRLQYDLEILKERLVEETQNAEERSGKVSRAGQALRLALDLLSGIKEEVIPASGDRKDEDAA